MLETSGAPLGAITRGDTGRTRRSQGIGLGLSIVKTVIERAGGTVEFVGNAPGAGFRIVLLAADAPLLA